MNMERAKWILSSFRRGSEDERDPMFCEALRQSQGDAELAGWLKEQEFMDATIRAELKHSSLPSDLIGTIRAGVAARRSLRRRRVFLALAACLAVSMSIAALVIGHSSRHDDGIFATCRADMVRFLRRFPRLDLETDRLSEARQWLDTVHGLPEIEVPAGLAGFPTLGCRTLEWRGQRLALVCFAVDGEVVHLILIPKRLAPDGPVGQEPQFARVEGMATAWWARGDLTYLVVSKGSEGFLRKRV